MEPNRPDRVERRLAAILAADVAGYSRLMGADEEGTLARLKAHRRELIKPKIAEHQGRIVKTTGDGILIEFPSVVEAVRCAVAVQQGMIERNTDVPSAQRIEFRVGINVGDIIIDGDDIYGDGVNVAARLEALAEPGSVYVSRAVRDQVRDRLAVDFEDMGEREVKNIARPVHAYRVRVQNESPKRAAAPPPDKGEKFLWVPRRLIWPGIAALLLLLAAAGAWRVSHPGSRPGATTAAAERASIAVLPFANLSGDAQQDYFSDGLTEDILTSLARFPQLFVIARNSTFVYKNKPVDVAEVGRALGVRYVLEGSVQKANDRLRITAQLIEARTSGHIWADRYDRPVTDVFTVQDEITERIVSTLVANIARADIEATSRKAPENLGAYDLYLQGRELSRTSIKANILEAARLFEKAIALDPGFAPAYAALANVQYTAIALQWDPAHRSESLDKGLSYAHRALALDPSLPVANLALGKLYLRKHEYDEAVTWAQKAIERNPGDAESYAALANIFSFMGRSVEAVPLVERAIRLDPFHPPLYDMYLGRAYVLSGEYEKGIPLLRTCADRAPDFWPCPLYLASALAQLGRIEEARRAMLEAQRLHPIASIRDLVAQSDYRAGPELDRYLDGLRKAGLPEE